MNFDIIKKAGLLPGHFARLFGFKRVTVSMWVNGRAVPHHLHAELVARALGMVERGVKVGALPVSSTPRHTRLERTLKALNLPKLS